MRESDQNYLMIGRKPASARAIRRASQKLKGFTNGRNKNMPHPMGRKNVTL
jgi:hypothetical protein